MADLDPAFRNSALVFGVLLAWLVLTFWLLFAQLPRFWKRSGLILTLGGPVLLTILCRVENLRVDGGIWPILQWRFSALPDDLLEEHLGGAANRPVPDHIDLSGNLPTDWPAYRGRKRDGIVLGPTLFKDWTAKPPKLLWKHPIGGGHSSFAVADKALFTIEQRRGNEVITCYDAETGKQFWAFGYTALFDERMGDLGPRSTPTVSDGEVFAFGATGMLTCLDARTGTVKWGPVDVLANNSNVNWGMAGSPLVLEDVVIVNPGAQITSAPHGTAVAFDRKTGKPAWSTSTKYQAGYSSPTVVTLAGKRQLLLFDGEGIAGYELDDPAAKGKQLWRFPWETQQYIQVAQPLVLDDNRLLISSGYNVGSALLHISNQDGNWRIEQTWKKTAPQCKFSSPLFYRGLIYALDNVVLTAFEADTGKRIARGERYGFGQLLLCDDLLVVTGEHGLLALVDLAGGEMRELGSIQALEGRSWNPAALANGRIYWRNNKHMICYDLSGQ